MNSCLVVIQNTSIHGIVILPSLQFQHAPYIAAEIIICIVSATSNLLVCVAVAKNKRLRTVTNYFLVSLAVADFFVGCLAIPCAILTDLGLPNHNLYVCIVIVYMLIMLTQSSIFSLLAVAIERYIAILLPFHYQTLLKPRNAKFIILLIWFLAILLSSIPLLGWQGRAHQINYCFFFCVVNMVYLVYFNFFFCFFLPLLAFFVIYVHIFITVRGHVRRIAAVHTALEVPDRQNVRMRKEVKKASSIFLLVFVFVLCWAPIHILNCIQLFCTQCSVPIPLILTAIILSHANSAINPMLYAYRMKSFRVVFKSMFLRCQMTSSVPDITDSNGTSRKT